MTQYRFLFLKKQDGTEYPGNSLHGLVCAIQRYLKSQCGKDFRFFNDDFFSKLRTSLDTVMKEGSAAGIGVHSKRAKVITFDEENQLWSKNILGDGNDKQSVETLVYLLGLHFALREVEKSIGNFVGRILKLLWSTMMNGRNIWNTAEMLAKTAPVCLKRRKT